MRSTSQPVQSTQGLEAYWTCYPHGKSPDPRKLKLFVLCFPPLLLHAEGSSSLYHEAWSTLVHTATCLLDKAVCVVDANRHPTWGAGGTDMTGPRVYLDINTANQRVHAAKLQRLSAPASSEGYYESPIHPLGEAAMV